MLQVNKSCDEIWLHFKAPFKAIPNLSRGNWKDLFVGVTRSRAQYTVAVSSLDGRRGGTRTLTSSRSLVFETNLATITTLADKSGQFYPEMPSSAFSSSPTHESMFGISSLFMY